MRLLLAGDIHGDANHVVYLHNKAEEFGADLIFALGDFGYWEHSPDGLQFLRVVDKLSEKLARPMYWLDGNHENHVMLRKTYHDKVTPEGFWQIRDNILYSPRGHTWDWDGVRFMSMGGAYSVDRDQRRVGKSFWFEEMIDRDEAELAMEQGKVDVMLAHDLPAGIDMRAIMHHRGFDYRTIPQSEANRKMLRMIVEAVRPNYYFHGHYHLNYFQELHLENGHMIKVRGLACNDMGLQSLSVIDTEDYK